MKTFTAESVSQFAAQVAARADIPAPHAKALHCYRDRSGEPIYWRIRLKNHESGCKWIRPFFWNGGGFSLGEPPAPPEGKPLYGLHLLARNAAGLVVVTEGENKADALNRLTQGEVPPRWVAVTSGSAGSAQAADWGALTGRAVLVWPDNDEPGARYAADVCGELQGVAESVRVLDVSGLNLPPKGDAVDWVRAGGGAAEFWELVRSAQSSTQGALRTIERENAPDEGAPLPDSQAGTNSATASAEVEAEILRRLASLPPLEYDRQRARHAELLGVRASALDSHVRAMRKEAGNENEQGISFGDVQPWPDAINPAELLQELSETVKRFIVCQPETANAAALWAAMTWFIDVVQVAPLAVITAPEKRCGKSQMLFLLGRLSQRPLVASNISPAAVFRTIEAWKPTLLIDEADAFMRENEELRGLLNCGHTRDSAYTVRIVGESMTPTRFSVWGAKAIAGIGHLADTLMDRAITLELRRKLSHEKIDRIRHAAPELFETLAAKLARFACDYGEAVQLARPSLPPALNDRAQDNWEPLLSIADVAGGMWPEKARQAALKLSASDSSSESAGGELLADIREIFELKRLSKISTCSLIAALCEDEEKGWATYNRGRPLSPRQLSKKLEGYGIRSKTIRIGAHDTPKGFDLIQFDDAFERYLKCGGVADKKPCGGFDLQSATPEPAPLLECGGVADKKGGGQNALDNLELVEL